MLIILLIIIEKGMLVLDLPSKLSSPFLMLSLAAEGELVALSWPYDKSREDMEDLALKTKAAKIINEAVFGGACSMGL